MLAISFLSKWCADVHCHTQDCKVPKKMTIVAIAFAAAITELQQQ